MNEKEKDKLLCELASYIESGDANGIVLASLMVNSHVALNRFGDSLKGLSELCQEWEKGTSQGKANFIEQIIIDRVRMTATVKALMDIQALMEGTAKSLGETLKFVAEKKPSKEDYL